MQRLCDHCLAAPSSETPQIQQIHIVAAHAICGLVERNLFGGAGKTSKIIIFINSLLCSWLEHEL